MITITLTLFMMMTIYTTHSVSVFIIDHSLDESFDFSVCMEFLELQGKLGEGGFGQVYLAYDKLNKRKVAVKFLTSSDHPLTP